MLHGKWAKWLISGLVLWPASGCGGAPAERDTSRNVEDQTRDTLKATPVQSGLPNRVVVKFESTGVHAVTEDAERWLAERRPFRDAAADRDVGLERKLGKWGVSAAHALFRERVGMRTAAAKTLFESRVSAARSRFAARAARAPSRPGAAGAPDLSNVYVLTLGANADPATAARELAGDAHVVYAQPDFVMQLHFTPNDPFFASSNSWGQGYDDLWALKKIGTPAAWDSTQGDGVTVAVVDSGVDMTHPDIAANVWTNSDEIPGNGIDDDQNGFVDDVHGWDFVGGDNDPTDQLGHGTHVAGTIAAVGNNALGIVGVAPRARIMPVQGFDANGSSTASSLSDGILYAARNGADVINNSWGCASPCPSNPVIEDAAALAHDLGAVVVFSAGNSSADVQSFSPQNQPDVVVVSASDENDARTGFSNFGMVDVAAPGGAPDSEPTGISNILSLKSNVCNICQPGLLVGSNLVRLAGTSMAAPHVSGLAALILEQNPSYSPEEVRQVLRRSAVDVSSPGIDTDSGYGRISASRAVLEPRPLAALITAPLVTLSAVTQVDVQGSASGTGFASYRVDFGAGTSPTSFTAIASSSTPVSQGRLGTWNLGSVADGSYTLRVSALTTDGRTYEDRQRVTIDNVAISAPPPGSSTFVRTGAVVTLAGTVTPANFSRYTVNVRRSDGTLLSGANVTLIGGGLGRVVNGTLATWNTSGAPYDNYTLEVSVALTSGGPIVEASSPVVVDPTLHPGFPVQLGAPFTPSDHVTVADVNRDGAQDLVLGVGNDVYVIDGSGASLPGFPQTTSDLISRSPAVGDLTGDGKPEIVASTVNGQIYVWDSNGVALPGWPRSFDPDFAGPDVAIEDIDGDGKGEIVVGDNALRVLRADGSSLPGFPVALQTNATFGAPAIGDVQGNGSSKEIAVATRVPAGSLYLVSSTGSVLPGWPQPLPQTNASGSIFQTAYPTLGDIDGDGTLEVVIAGMDGSAFAFHYTGAPVSGWPKPTQSQLPDRANTPSLADLDGNGRLDVLVGSLVDRGAAGFTNDLNAWRGDGTSLTGWPFQRSHTFSNDGFGPAAIADLDGDGALDVVAWSDPDRSSGVVRALYGLRRDGSVLPGFPKITPATGNSVLVMSGNPDLPGIGDFDHDGLLELAWLDPLGNLFVWDLGAPASAATPWPMFQHDAAHTGRASPLAVCTPETNAAFCSRLGRNCGGVTGPDNCGTTRTVGSCGSCSAQQTCSSAGVCQNTSSLSAAITLPSNWNTGYCANVTVTNGGASAVATWTVVLNLNQSSVTNSWNANWTLISGSSYRLTPLSWNSSIASGGNVTVGFCANKTGANYTPTLTSVN